MQNKTVWHLCSNRWNSAITEYALSSAQALALRAWNNVYSPLAATPGAVRAKNIGLEGPAFQSFHLGELPRFLSEARRIRPDIILLYGGPESFLSRFFRSCPRVRFRGLDRDLQEKLPGWRTRRSLAHCAAVLTPAQVLAKRFQAVLGSTPVHQVTLGLDKKRFYFAASAYQDAVRPTLRVLGRLDPVKGHAMFMQIYRQVLKRWPANLPPPILEIVGQAANLSEAQIRSTAAAAELIEGQDWLLRSERVQDMASLLSSTHLGVIPSLGSEIICRVAEEFLLVGCPIFVSGVGSLEECLFDARAGVSYRGLDLAARAELLLQSLQQAFHESLQEKQQRATRAAAVFSLEKMGEDLEKVLLSCL